MLAARQADLAGSIEVQPRASVLQVLLGRVAGAAPAVVLRLARDASSSRAGCSARDVPRKQRTRTDGHLGVSETVRQSMTCWSLLKTS